MSKKLHENEWDAVFDQIRKDVSDRDFTAIHEILEKVPPQRLRTYIEEVTDD